ncbi:MAG: tRNA pseudouridine(13) synthase TruD, partial [Planctomycetota bacterium]|nr:tRNA pseudouridine(13) synthase TruD [Planctomycetota bacterium]
DHVWMWVEKRGLSTLDMLKEFGGRLGRHEKSFGIAGLKDARAVSRQWVSVELGDEAACRALDVAGVRVLKVSRHGNKLRLGHSRGNRFEIVLRDCSAGALEIAQANLAELEQLGVPNYFGEQRFGKRGSNLAKGLEALRGGARSMSKRMPRRVFGLVLSAVQSELFNRVVIQRRERLGVILPGDLAQLHRNNAVFTVEDPAPEQPRADALELSASGPMPGPDMMVPTGEPLEMELAALAELGLDGGEFEDLPFGLARGERRPLRCPLKSASARAHEHGVKVGFTLPKGSYATSVLRELLNETIWFAQR